MFHQTFRENHSLSAIDLDPAVYICNILTVVASSDTGPCFLPFNYSILSLTI